MKLASGYRALRLLRQGEVTSVYDAWSEKRGCRCVVKVLRPGRADRADARALAAEGRLLLSLTHPHIVRAYELVGRPRLTLVLETLPGETLSRLLERRRRLSAPDLARLGLQLAAALGYLHRAGALHLDVKPSNVVCHAGLAKLIDLGIARPPGRSSRGVGTDDYLAPEQARGSAISPATDVFGLGGMLFQSATGHPPFRSRRGHWAQLEGRAVPISSLRSLPAELSRAIDACLEPDPDARPTLDELARRLCACLV